MKLYLIAGEASGDLHGANLIRALRRQEPDVECRVWGGDRMAAAGGELVKHYRDLAFMGFLEVARNLRTILGNLAFCKQDILAFQPDALVLIDYPGFNLRIAKWARQQGLKVVYYISPQIWAWHSSRVHAIRRDVDKMLVILPFEREFYRKYGAEVEFVGHPLLDELGLPSSPGLPPTPSQGGGGVTPDTAFGIRGADIPAPPPWEGVGGRPGRPVIALLPGSRRQEVRRILPPMLEVTADFPDHRFVVAGTASLPKDFYRSMLEAYPEVELVVGRTYYLLRGAVAALVKSGTSTLETALLDVPQVVCYAGNPVSYFIARRLVEVNYISLVNLILDRPLVRELIQQDLTRANITEALGQILDRPDAARIRAGYAELREKLGSGGASDRAAESILRLVRAGTAS